MNKIDFIKRAPIYYAMAICSILDRTNKASLKTREDIDNVWDKEKYILSNDDLWNAAVNFLREHGAIEIVEDDFGPDTYRSTDALKDWFNGPFEQEYPAVARFKAAGRNWLKEAISEVNSAYVKLGIRPDDFNKLAESEWQPIPIDSGNENFQQVQGAVDKAVEIIEGDNAYPVHAAEERKYVLANLKAFREFIKENKTIYVAQLNAFVIEPITLVIKRYGPSATGVAASALKQAVFEWIKNAAAKLLTLIG